MSRKSIGGAVVKCSDLKKVLNDKKQYAGIIFKIPQPTKQVGVTLELYGAIIGEDGITEGEKSNCIFSSCSIKKKAESPNLGNYEFEHCAQFALFNSKEPFIAYFSRSQIDMLLSLGGFKKAFISSFMPISSNPIVNAKELIPNFSLEIQPLVLPKPKKSKGRLNQKSTSTGYDLPQTLSASGCPRTWQFL